MAVEKYPNGNVTVHTPGRTWSLMLMPISDVGPEKRVGVCVVKTDGRGPDAIPASPTVGMDRGAVTELRDLLTFALEEGMV